MAYKTVFIVNYGFQFTFFQIFKKYFLGILVRSLKFNIMMSCLVLKYLKPVNNFCMYYKFNHVWKREKFWCKKGKEREKERSKELCPLLPNPSSNGFGFLTIIAFECNKIKI